MATAGSWNERLIAHLRRAGHLRSDRVAAAFRAVPRHTFLPHLSPEAAYQDEAHVTKRDADGRPLSSSSQPAIMAVMLEQLGVEPGQRVLEIGAGTGYNAALLASLVGDGGSVVTVDIDEEITVAARSRLEAAGFSSVHVECADGSTGWAAGAPYDRIMLTVGASDLAPAWIEQLADDGRLVLPLSLRGAECSVAFERRAGHLVSTSVHTCGFVPMRGALARQGSVVVLGEEGGLFVEAPEELSADPGGLHAALHAPGEAVATGMRVTAAEVRDGLALWLALHQPRVVRLVAYADAPGRDLVPPLVDVPPVLGTLAVIGDGAMAALTRLGDPRAETFELAVVPFGPGGAELVETLARRVSEWDAAGRPATRDLRIEAHMRTPHPRTPAPVTVIGQHAEFAIDFRPA